MGKLEEQSDQMRDLAAPSTEGSVSVSVEQRGPLIIQMWTEYFRHLSTMGVAGCAGLLILLELEILAGDTSFWISLAALASGTVLSLQGTRVAIELVEKGGGPTKRLRMIDGVSSALLGLGAGVLTAALMLQ